MGPCVVDNAGSIIIGERLCVRSRSHNRVEISVAPGATLCIGNDVFINQGARLTCSKRIVIGSGCFLGDEVVILDTDYHAPQGGLVREEPVHLEDRVWLATRVIVMRGVTIGQGSVVGAGSVVTRSIPPYSLAAGVPAKVVRPIAVR